MYVSISVPGNAARSRTFFTLSHVMSQTTALAEALKHPRELVINLFCVDTNLHCLAFQLVARVGVEPT